MQDYTKLGLNPQLQPLNAPVNDRLKVTTAREFDEAYEIPLGGIDYTNITATSRPYSAIVSLSGEKGTFKDVQLAINYVNSLGGGVVFIKNGTYTFSNSIVLYDQVDVLGESALSVILDFNMTSNHFDTNGADYFKLERFRIKNCQSTTGSIYVNDSSIFNIERVFFEDNSNSAGDHCDIYLDNGSGNGSSFTILDCASTGAGTFIEAGIDAGVGSSILNNKIVQVKKYGFNGKLQGNISGNVLVNTVAHTSAFNGNFTSARITNNYIESTANTSDLLVFSDSSGLNISANYFKTSSANKNTVILQNTSVDNQIVGNAVFSNGSGKAVILNAVGDDSNTVVGNRLFGGITDNGTGNVVASNVI